MTAQSLEERVAASERNLRLMAEAVSALADDNLRLASMMDELARAGVLPPLPWRLAAFHVELRHAREALARGAVSDDGVPLEERVAALEGHLEELRGNFVSGLPRALPYSPEALERNPDEPDAKT